MAWVTPRTWAGGELVTETQLNEQIKDNLNHLKTAIDSNGKITALSSSYVADLSGANLTGVAKTASSNDFTAGTHDFNGGTGTRFILPIGANKWAT